MNEEEAKKADAKSARKTFIIVIVAIVMAVAAIGFSCLKLKYDSDRQNEYMTDFTRAMGHQQEAWVKSQDAHTNYNNNLVAMSLFNNITTTYPFLVAQANILFTDVDALINNITVPNYYTAFKQLFLCEILNTAYEQNFTEYSVIIRDENFTYMDYNFYEDVAYFTDKPPTSPIQIGNEGYWVYDYTPTLKEMESKLDYISGVLETEKKMLMELV